MVKKEKLYLYVLKGRLDFKEKLEEFDIHTEESWMYRVNRNSVKGKQIMKIINA